MKVVQGEKKVEFEAAEDTVQEFVYQFQVFSHENGVHKVNRKEIIELQITASALVEELKKPWNEDREVNCRKDETKSNEESDKIEDDLCFPSKILDQLVLEQGSQ